MNETKRYYLQSDPECMDLYYLEYDGERAPEDIQFVYSPSNIHALEDLIDLLNKKNDECITLDKHISFLDERNAMLEKEINRLKNEIMLSEKTRDVLADEVCDLKEENEELTEIINFCRCKTRT